MLDGLLASWTLTSFFIVSIIVIMRANDLRPPAFYIKIDDKKDAQATKKV